MFFYSCFHAIEDKRLEPTQNDTIQMTLVQMTTQQQKMEKIGGKNEDKRLHQKRSSIYIYGAILFLEMGFFNFSCRFLNPNNFFSF